MLWPSTKTGMLAKIVNASSNARVIIVFTLVAVSHRVMLEPPEVGKLHLSKRAGRRCVTGEKN